MLLRQLYVSFYFLMIRRPPRSTLFPTRRSSDLVRQGQKVMVLPGGLKSAVKEIWTYDGSRMEAFCPQSITLVLEDDIDVSRRSEEHTSELQSPCNLVCRLLLEKKKVLLKRHTRL